jgi:hypothetical protein
LIKMDYKICFRNELVNNQVNNFIGFFI